MKHYFINLIILFIILLSSVETSLAQMPIWSLPSDFIAPTIGSIVSLPTPTGVGFPDGYDGRQATINHQIMVDENGDIAFFMVDKYLYNKNGYLINTIGDEFYNEYPLQDIYSPGALLSTEMISVPRPGHCGQYYLIFSSKGQGSSKWGMRLYYALVDINAPNPIFSNIGEKGKLLKHSNNFYFSDHNNPAYFVPLSLSTQHVSTEWGSIGMAVTPLKADESRIMFANFAGRLARFIIDENGINLDGPGNGTTDDEVSVFSVDQLGNEYVAPLATALRAESEIVKTTNGYRLAFSFLEQANTLSNSQYKLVLLDVDINGHIIADHSITFPYTSTTQAPLIPIGLEFSAYGSFLFCSHNIGTNQNLNTGLFRIDWTGNAPTTPEPVSVPPQIDVQNSYIEIDSIGNLFLPDATYLYKIDNPTGAISNVSVSQHTFINYNSVSDNSTTFQIYKLVDQVDQGDYFYAPTYTCCKNYEAFIESYTAGPGSLNWSPGNNPFNNATTVNIIQELRILSGTTVNITDMEFYFEEGAQMVIEKGARVISNNSKFTSLACQGIMWEGIQVEGTSTLPQAYYPNTANGELRLLNNSEVSNAYVGVRLHKLDPNGNIVWGTTGGIIRATNSSFINNKKDVEFLTFKFDNKSSFTNCEFITNSALAHPNEITAEHVSILQNRKINFLGCDFKNTTAGLYDHDLRGTGIKSIQAHYKVTYNCLSNSFPPTIGCSNKDRTTFEGLYYGINAVNASLGNSVEVKYSDFNEVERGIYLGTVDFGIIANNNFNLKTDLPDVPIGNLLYSRTYGLYLHECTGYEVENNDFTFSQHGTSPMTIGTIVYNSNQNGTKSYANEIYHNTYNELDYGIIAFGANTKYDDIYDANNVYQYTENNKTGLTFRCNTLNNTTIDHIAFKDGIADEIGNCSPYIPANNIFSYNSNRQSDIWNYDTNPYFDSDYNYDGDASSYTQPLIFNPNTNPMVQPYQCLPTVDLSATCPVNFYGKSRFGKKQKITFYKNVAENGKQFLETVDTEVAQAILNYQSGNISVGVFKNILEQYTPYISDKDIETLIQLSLPPGITQNILTSNSPLSKASLETLYYSSLPNGVKKKVYKAQTGGKTYREQKEDEITGNISLAKLYLNSLARDYVHDTTIVDGLDSLKLLLKDKGFEHKECKIASINITAKKYATAQQTIDSLKIANPVEYELFCKLSSLLIELEQATEGCYSLKSDSSKMVKLNELKDLNDYSDKYCYKASEIYNKIFNYEYDEPFPYLVKSHAASNYKESLDFSSLINDSYSIYPSPAKDILTIETGTDDKITIKVFDITGKLMLTTQASTIATLNISELSSGTYIVHFVYPNGTVKNDRFVKK